MLFVIEKVKTRTMDKEGKFSQWTGKKCTCIDGVGKLYAMDRGAFAMTKRNVLVMDRKE